MDDGYVYVGCRCESELAERFDTARRLDQRTRSAALRVAMNAYIEAVAVSRSAMNDDGDPLKATSRGRVAADAAEREAVG